MHMDYVQSRLGYWLRINHDRGVRISCLHLTCQNATLVMDFSWRVRTAITHGLINVGGFGQSANNVVRVGMLPGTFTSLVIGQRAGSN